MKKQITTENTGKRPASAKSRKKMKIVTAALFLAAISLLGASGIGAARAATIYQSQEYNAQLEMLDIGVALLENGTQVSSNMKGTASASGALLTNLLPEGEEFALNKKYQEEISVENIGTIDEYIRLVIDVYWLDEDGNKLTDLSPQLIGLALNEDTGWIIDPSSSYLNGTGEQIVAYYYKALASGEYTEPISSTLKIEGVIAKSVSRETVGNVITTTFLYDGVQFAIAAETDGVQTHNAEDAILSTWGADVTVQDGILSLNE